MKFDIGRRWNRETRAWDLRVADDGTIWREATTRELAEAGPDTLLYMGRGQDTEPTRKAEYDDLRLPGDYSFLIGISQLIGGIYIKVADSYQAYTEAHPDKEEATT